MTTEGKVVFSTLFFCLLLLWFKCVNCLTESVKIVDDVKADASSEVDSTINTEVLYVLCSGSTCHGYKS